MTTTHARTHTHTTHRHTHTHILKRLYMFVCELVIAKQDVFKGRATTRLYISDYYHYHTPHHVTTGTLHLLITTHLGRLVPRRINHLYVWNETNTWVFCFSSKQLCDCTRDVPYAQMWRVQCFQIRKIMCLRNIHLSHLPGYNTPVPLSSHLVLHNM